MAFIFCVWCSVISIDVVHVIWKVYCQDKCYSDYSTIYLGHGQVRMVTIALILTIYLGHEQVIMVTIALILTIYLGHGQVIMVTIALILTIYLGHGQVNSGE
jgi:hypothetical protein